MDAFRNRPSGQRNRGQRESSHAAATTLKHAKLSRRAHARRVADAPIARAPRSDLARPVRSAGIVPLLRRQTLPPAPHLLRCRPGSVPPAALVPQDGAAQNGVAQNGVAEDAAARGPARSPQVVVMPRSPDGAKRNPGTIERLHRRSRISLRCILATGFASSGLRLRPRPVIAGLCKVPAPPLRRGGFLRYVRAELRSLRAFLRAGRAPSGPVPPSGPSRQPGPNQ